MAVPFSDTPSTAASAADLYDIVIVGAGPGGLSAAINAQKSNLRYVLLEKSEHIADTIFCYPKGKPVMAEPSVIPVVGDMWMEPATREVVLERWRGITNNHCIDIRVNHDVSEIKKATDSSFSVKCTNGKVFHAEKVIYAAGTQGNPNSLRPGGKAPGEDLPHVFNRLKDPALFVGRDIYVVGGGDAAIETAIALALRNQVSIVVRKPEFSPEAKNSLVRQALELESKGSLKILFKHEIEAIERGAVVLQPRSDHAPANFVFVKIGTQKPRRFLETIGVQFVSPDPKAPPRLKDNYETSVPGLYLIGAVCGRGADLIKNAINQGFEVVEHITGRKVVPADETVLLTKLAPIREITGDGTVAERITALTPRAPVMAYGAADELRDVLLLSTFHIKNAGETIYSQGEYSTSFWNILDGAVDVFIKSPAGDSSPYGDKVSTLEAGEFFGEINLIAARVRSGTVKAARRCVLWEISRKAMLKFIQGNAAAKDIVDKTFLTNWFRTNLFGNIDRKLLAPLANYASVRAFDREAIIINEGDAGDAFYFIRSGIVKVTRRTKREHRGVKEDTLTYLSAGQFFGEMALLTGEVRSATVSAVDPVEVIEIRKDDFLSFLAEHPQLRPKFETEVVRRKKADEQADRDEVLGRVSEFLVEAEAVVSENALLIDEERCIHCDNCVTACESVHEDRQTRIKRTGMKFANILIANSCRHCENPLCMTDCPPGDAILRHPSGEVYIVEERCIACGNCASNCPYDNIFMYHPEHESAVPNESSGALFRLKEQTESMSGAEAKPETARGFAIKCDLCQGIQGGPACVRSCPTGALERLTRGTYDQKILSLATQRKHAIF